MSQPAVSGDASAHLPASVLYNHDLAPTGTAQRSWRWYHFAALWVGMMMNIASYMLASGLTEQVGWNLAAVIALVLGVLPNLPGFLTTAFPAAFPGVSDAFKGIYTYAWFVGLAIAAIVYGVLMKFGKSTHTSVARA
jgi:cytosine/uracil/thiamine/allantoin permease